MLIHRKNSAIQANGTSCLSGQGFVTVLTCWEGGKELALLARSGRFSPLQGQARCQSSFFISPANAANGLWVALAILGLLREPSSKYC